MPISPDGNGKPGAVRRRRGLGMNSGTEAEGRGEDGLRRKKRETEREQGKKRSECLSRSHTLTLFASAPIFCGAEGSRTPVQTYSSNAFYMFSFVLIVGVSRTETNLLHP